MDADDLIFNKRLYFLQSFCNFLINSFVLLLKKTNDKIFIAAVFILYSTGFRTDSVEGFQ